MIAYFAPLCAIQRRGNTDKETDKESHIHTTHRHTDRNSSHPRMRAKWQLTQMTWLYTYDLLPWPSPMWLQRTQKQFAKGCGRIDCVTSTLCVIHRPVQLKSAFADGVSYVQKLRK